MEIRSRRSAAGKGSGMENCSNISISNTMIIVWEVDKGRGVAELQHLPSASAGEFINAEILHSR